MKVRHIKHSISTHGAMARNVKTYPFMQSRSPRTLGKVPAYTGRKFRNRADWVLVHITNHQFPARNGEYNWTYVGD